MSESDNSDQAAKVLLSKKLAEFCQSDSLSEEGLREIIEHHELKTNNSHVSDYEFFRRACGNERITEGIIQCLLEYFPDSIRATDDNGRSPLHYACSNTHHVTVNIIQLLIDAAPASVRSVTNEGRMPLHFLCRNKTIDDAAALEILELLIMKHPEAAQRADNYGQLPIHFAAGWGRRSTEFCRLLIEAYPGSERRTDANGNLSYRDESMLAMRLQGTGCKSSAEIFPESVLFGAPLQLGSSYTRDLKLENMAGAPSYYTWLPQEEVQGEEHTIE